jgi:hypothetical protein
MAYTVPRRKPCRVGEGLESKTTGLEGPDMHACISAQNVTQMQSGFGLVLPAGGRRYHSDVLLASAICSLSVKRS